MSVILCVCVQPTGQWLKGNRIRCLGSRGLNSSFFFLMAQVSRAELCFLNCNPSLKYINFSAKLHNVGVDMCRDVIPKKIHVQPTRLNMRSLVHNDSTKSFSTKPRSLCIVLRCEYGTSDRCRTFVLWIVTLLCFYLFTFHISVFPWGSLTTSPPWPLPPIPHPQLCTLFVSMFWCFEFSSGLLLFLCPIC